MSALEIASRYTAFAVIATICNLSAQRLGLFVFSGAYELVVAMALGTAVGLVVKYLLDKHWIFGDRSTGVSAHARRFSLYSFAGLFTTILFWGFEVSFWTIWLTDAMREVGAVLGLSIGYFLKYQLDKRFVFDRPRTG